MASLYEINAAIMGCVDLETGEIIDVEQLQALQLEREQKIENVALWCKTCCPTLRSTKRKRTHLQNGNAQHVRKPTA